MFQSRNINTTLLELIEGSDRNRLENVQFVLVGGYSQVNLRCVFSRLQSVAEFSQRIPETGNTIDEIEE